MRNTQFLPRSTGIGVKGTRRVPAEKTPSPPTPPSRESTSELAVLCGRSGRRPAAAAWLAWDAKESRGGPSMVSLCANWAENGDKKDRSGRTVPGGGRTGPKHWEQSKASATSKPAGEAKRTRNTEQPGPSKSGSPFVSNPWAFKLQSSRGALRLRQCAARGGA